MVSEELMSSIAKNLAEVRERVAKAAARSGNAVQLLAVSKTWPVERLREAVDAGQMLFGENRLQEGGEKVSALPIDLEWHFIGGLQRNKVRKVLPLFPVVHSVSSTKLAYFIDRVAGELGLKPKIFLEVNIAEEATKGGYLIDDLRRDFDEIWKLDHLSLQGLMCIPPYVSEAEGARPWFAKLRELQGEMEQRIGHSLPELSMGMSGDFEVAIEEGSTIVRVGSAIFGSRG